MTKISNLYGLTNYVTANNSGNVVIAAPTSGYALDVTGTGRFTGALTGTSITLSNSLNFTSIYGGNINGYDGTSLVPMNYSASQHQYYAGGTLKMMLLGNGNLLLGTTTDNGSKLQVTGTASFSGALSGTSATFSDTITSTLAGQSSRGLYFTANQPSGINWYDTDDVEQYSMGIIANSGAGYWGLWSSTSSTAIDRSTTTPIFKIARAGAATFSSSVTATNLSINTTSTSGRIDVQASGLSSFPIYWRNNNGGYGGGVYNTGGNNMQLYLATSAGTENVLIAASGTSYFNGGNVGIGTTSPQRLLDARGAVNLGTTAASVSSTPSAYADIHLRTWAGADLSPARITVLDNWIDYVATYTDGHRFRNWSSNGVLRDLMIITGSGNVGIGTSSPVNSKVHISKSSSETAPNEQIRMQSTGGAVPSTWRLDVNATNGAFAITDNNVGERFWISSSGNVGIGTTSPSYGLDIQGSSAASAYLNITKTGYASAFMQPYNDGVYMGSFNSYPVYMRTNNSTVMTLTTSGNVGIGTTSPANYTNYITQTINGTNGAIVQLQSSGTASLRLIGEGTDAYIDNLTTGGALLFRTNNATERMRITSGGNVLIGTTSDNGAKLRVSGLNQSSNFVTDFGNASIPFGSYGTFYTVSNYQNALYMVTLQYNGYSNYTAYAIIAQNDSALVIMNQVNNNAQIQVSGLNIQGKNDSGVTVSMVYKIIKIG